MAFVLDRLYSATFPFETHIEGIPDSLFCDANIMGASACTITSILIGGGSIYVQAVVTTTVGDVVVHSKNVTADANTKITLVDDNDVSYGWLLTGSVKPPETLTLDNISAPLCSNTCCTYKSVTPLNNTGITGNWVISGYDGVKIDYSFSGKTLQLVFNEDEGYFTIPSGDDIEYEKGIGICSICGIPGPTVAFAITDGYLYPVVEGDNGNGCIRDIVIIPNLVFEYPYFEPGKENADPEVRTTVFTGPVVISETNISWASGAVIYNGGFTVNTQDFQGSVGMNQYIDGIYGPTLFISWIACDRTDYIRSVIKTSTEDGSDKPYPLDDILRKR